MKKQAIHFILFVIYVKRTENLNVYLEDQVCSLELSTRLKELGVIKPSLFCWFHRTYPNDEWIITHNDLIPFNAGKDCNLELSKKEISAFTASELGEILPKNISIKTAKQEDEISNNFKFLSTRGIILEEEKFIDIWSVNYMCDTTSEIRNWERQPLLTKNIIDKNEANARAKMLIYLLENKLVELPK